MENKQQIKLKATRIYEKIYLQAGCERSEALMSLLSSSRGARSYLQPDELPTLARMGFNIEFSGELKPLKTELNRLNKVFNGSENGF